MPIQPWDDGPDSIHNDYDGSVDNMEYGEQDEDEERWSQEENAYREEYRDRPFNPNLNPNLFPADSEQIHQERAW